MSRLASIAKAGYYPTPENIVELLAQTITAPAGGRVLDPCAGQGELLLPIAKKTFTHPLCH
jgi:type I restriction-modification system DNA methylase subunit